MRLTEDEDRLRALADEQAALLRVAELVATGAGPDALFEAVAREASRLVGGDSVVLCRFEGPRTYTVVAAVGGPVRRGVRVEVAPDDDGVAAEILRTRRPARRDDYRDRPGRVAALDDHGFRAGVGAPVLVGDRLWGVLGAASGGPPFPEESEQRLERFAGLVAAALGNVQARAELQALADQQASLRRIAELSARGAPPGEVLAAVAVEGSRLSGVGYTVLLRYEADGSSEIVALDGAPEGVVVGMRAPPGGTATVPQVWRTGRAARADDLTGITDRWALVATGNGYTASLAVPIFLGGTLWGALVVLSRLGPLPAGTEQQLTEYAELVGTAIAAAEARAELLASRARIVASADEARRRLQRDVHDGAQQRLVHAVIALKLARDAAPPGSAAAGLVGEALGHAERANRELRDVLHGILPASIVHGGLRAGVESLVDDLPMPVVVRISVPRLPEAVETTAWFVVAEALTNVVKHAAATRARLRVELDGETLVVEVRDDGVGGADRARGSGLTGLVDRVEAAGGSLSVTSPAGSGTAVLAVLPLHPPDAAAPWWGAALRQPAPERPPPPG